MSRKASRRDMARVVVRQLLEQPVLSASAGERRR